MADTRKPTDPLPEPTGRPEPESEPESSADPEFGGASDLSETMVHADRARRRVEDSTVGDPWDVLTPKVQAFLERTHGRAALPKGWEFADLRQLVLARMVQDLPRLELRTRGEFWSWVRKLADNARIDLIRRERALRRGGGADVVDLDAEPDGDGPRREFRDPAAVTPSVIARTRELEAQEQDCVAALQNDEARQVYLLRRRDALDFAKIATLVGRSNEATVRVIYKRARDKVLACLGRHLDAYREPDR